MTNLMTILLLHRDKRCASNTTLAGECNAIQEVT